MRDSFDVLARLLPSDSLGERDIEALSLADIGDGLVAQSVKRRADRLALRVQHRGFEGNEYASFHGNLNYRMGEYSPRRRRDAENTARLRRKRSALSTQLLNPRLEHAFAFSGCCGQAALRGRQRFPGLVTQREKCLRWPQCTRLPDVGVSLQSKFVKTCSPGKICSSHFAKG